MPEELHQEHLRVFQEQMKAASQYIQDRIRFRLATRARKDEQDVGRAKPKAKKA